MRWSALRFLMRATSSTTVLLLALLLLGSSAGCLATDGADENKSPITMNVHYPETSGVITERIQNNAVLSQTGVELSFDFARVVSNAGVMKTFSLDPGDDDDGSNAVTVNANEEACLLYTSDAADE